MKASLLIAVVLVCISYTSCAKSVKKNFEKVLGKGGGLIRGSTTSKRLAALEKQVKLCCEKLDDSPPPAPTTVAPTPPPPECCKPPKFSAFSVMSTEAQFLDVNEVINYQKVYFNEGLDYKDNQYTCPVDGFYYFTFTLQSYALKKSDGSILRAQAALFIDQTRVVDTVSYNSDPAHYIITSSGNSVITKCRKGQKVFVKSDFGQNAIWSFSAFPRNTFSGYLMKEQDLTLFFDAPIRKSNENITNAAGDNF